MANEQMSAGKALASLSAARLYGMQLLPGVCFCLVVVLASSYIAEHYGTTRILGALLLGMAFNSVAKYPEFAQGLEFCSKQVLRFGVALLGVRITFSQIYTLGYKPVLVVAVVVASTIGFSLLLGRLIKLDRAKAIISGAAVAICGASAALAVAAVLDGNKDNEKHLLCTLVGVTGLSTIVMILYPGMITSMGLSPEQMGLFLGASIHDVAQVFGAGHMISDEVAELATYTKMLRVSALVPTILLLIFWFRASSAQRSTNRALALPPFLIAFVVLMLAANVQVLNAETIALMGSGSQLCLWVAMAALGTKTNLVEMWQVGRKPFALLLANTVFIAALSMLMVA